MNRFVVNIVFPQHPTHFISRRFPIGRTFQISPRYSWIERSAEKRPTRALFRIDIRVQFFSSR
jgi:hypothetical protein